MPFKLTNSSEFGIHSKIIIGRQNFFITQNWIKLNREKVKQQQQKKPQLILNLKLLILTTWGCAHIETTPLEIDAMIGLTGCH